MPLPDTDHALQSALGLPDTVGIHRMRLDQLSSDWVESAHLPVALSRAVEKRRREFLAGRCCAKHALRQAGGELLAEGLGMDADRLPQWPAGWLGSISHSSLVAVAVASRSSSCMALGIDVEKWLDDKSCADVREQVAAPGELELFGGSTEQRALTLLFSAKETLYKALYPQVRQFFDFMAACVVAVAPGRLDLQLCQDWSAHWRQGQVLAVRYVCHPEHIYTALHLPR